LYGSARLALCLGNAAGTGSAGGISSLSWRGITAPSWFILPERHIRRRWQARGTRRRTCNVARLQTAYRLRCVLALWTARFIGDVIRA